MYGNKNELGDASGASGRVLFSFNNSPVQGPGIGLPGEIGFIGERVCLSNCAGAFDGSMKIRGRSLFTPQVVPITASGLQG